MTDQRIETYLSTFAAISLVSNRSSKLASRRESRAVGMVVESLEARWLMSFSNWSKIGPAIALVPEATGQLSSATVVNFGTTVYTGPLNVKNTLDRIRADGTPVDSDDGSVYTNPQADGLPVDGTYYEFVVKPTNGTDHSFTFSSPGPMRILLATGGDVFFTGDHYSTFQAVYIAGSATPTIGSFTDSPTRVVAGTATTLTASNVTETGRTISNVKFYRESNGTSGLQTTGDTLVGTDTTASSNAYSISASTTGLAAGTYTYYAVATDASSVSSAASSATLTVTAAATSGAELTWNVAGQTAFGTQGLAATAVAAGVTNSLGLTRGSGVSASGSAASNAWGGTNWASTSAAGISGSEFVTFGLKVATGKTLSLSSIDLNYRRSSTGAASGLWQYQLNSGTWVTIGDFASEFSSTSSSGAAAAEISLSGIAGLQGLAAGTAVNFRLTPYGATGTGGTWYIYNINNKDLVVSGSTNAVPAVVKAAKAAASASTFNATQAIALPAWMTSSRDLDETNALLKD